MKSVLDGQGPRAKSSRWVRTTLVIRLATLLNLDCHSGPGVPLAMYVCTVLTLAAAIRDLACPQVISWTRSRGPAALSRGEACTHHTCPRRDSAGRGSSLALRRPLTSSLLHFLDLSTPTPGRQHDAGCRSVLPLRRLRRPRMRVCAVSLNDSQHLRLRLRAVRYDLHECSTSDVPSRPGRNGGSCSALLQHPDPSFALALYACKIHAVFFTEQSFPSLTAQQARRAQLLRGSRHARTYTYSTSQTQSLRPEACNRERTHPVHT